LHVLLPPRPDPATSKGDKGDQTPGAVDEGDGKADEPDAGKGAGDKAEDAADSRRTDEAKQARKKAQQERAAAFELLLPTIVRCANRDLMDQLAADFVLINTAQNREKLVKVGCYLDERLWSFAPALSVAHHAWARCVVL